VREAAVAVAGAGGGPRGRVLALAGLVHARLGGADVGNERCEAGLRGLKRRLGSNVLPLGAVEIGEIEGEGAAGFFDPWASSYAPP
jgi:hypothetical protein